MGVFEDRDDQSTTASTSDQDSILYDLFSPEKESFREPISNLCSPRADWDMYQSPSGHFLSDSDDSLHTEDNFTPSTSFQLLPQSMIGLSRTTEDHDSYLNIHLHSIGSAPSPHPVQTTTVCQYPSELPTNTNYSHAVSNKEIGQQVPFTNTSISNDSRMTNRPSSPRSKRNQSLKQSLKRKGAKKRQRHFFPATLKPIVLYLFEDYLARGVSSNVGEIARLIFINDLKPHYE